ncbi:hypothetical protein AB0L53_34395 [Nonomuraea sp. NPDC052129]|uniref:hypothetical protein n=1 Tax=Nonomuraea sp. NPDC052129 TaxID=3154651 RepID=UPI003426F461
MSSGNLHSDDETLNGRIVPPAEGHDAAGGTRHPVHLCHHGCDCWQRNFDMYLQTTPAREPEQLDNLESHALLSAKKRASQLVRQQAEQMDALRGGLISKYHEAQSSLAELRAIVCGGALGNATQDLWRLREARIATLTPRRPLWLRIIVWPTIVAVGGFDTWYFRNVFQKFIGNSDINGLEEILTLLPGITLTVGLLISGTTLGEPVHRAIRLHTGRQKTRHGFGRFLAGLGYWAFLLLLPSMLLLVAASWAVQRTREANATSAQSGDVTQLALPQDFVTILIVTLTLCAFALKIAAHDAYASQEFDARWRLRKARRASKRRVREAGADVRRHSVAWSNLSALRDDLISRISERYSEAYQFMMYARGFHEKAGSLPPAFSNTERGSSLRDRVQPELAGVIGPEPEFGALHQVEEAIQRFRPDSLEEELRILREEWIAQLSTGMSVSPTAQPAPGGETVP